MNRILQIAVILLLGLSTTACDSSPASPTPIPPTHTHTPAPSPTSTLTQRPPATQPPMPRTVADRAEDQAYIRWIHAAPELGAVNIRVEALSVASNMEYRRITEPNGLAAGDYNVRVSTAQRGPGEETHLLETTAAITGGQNLIGIISSDGETIALTFHQEYADPLNKGESRISLIHALQNGSDTALVSDGTPLTLPVAQGNQSIPVALPFGLNNIELQTEGQTLATYTDELRERHGYTIVLTGSSDNPDLITFSRAVPGFASVRAIHGVETSGPVDVYVNGTLIIPSLEHTRISEWQEIASGPCTIALYASPSDRNTDDPLTSAQFTLPSDESITLVIAQRNEDFSLIRVQQEFNPTPPERARMIFVHAVGDAQPVQIEVSGELPDDSSLIAYRQATTAMELMAGRSNLAMVHVDNMGRGAGQLEYAEEILIEAGFDYLFVITGRAPEAPPLIFGEHVGEDESLGIFAEAETTPLPLVSLRVGNALETNDSLDFYVDTAQIAGNLAQGNISGPVMLPEGTHTIAGILSGGEPDAIVVSTLDLRAGRDYVIYAYGDTVAGISAINLEMPAIPISEARSSLRFINTTLDRNIRFDLSLADGSTQVSIPTPHTTEQARQDPFRQPLFARAMKLVNDIYGGNASVSYGVEPGLTDLYVIDPVVEMVAATVTGVTLDPGVHYDVIAYQRLDSREVRARLIPYSLTP